MLTIVSTLSLSLMALPRDRIVDKSNALTGIIWISMRLGISLIVLFQPLPILEAISAHYTPSNLYVANAILTTSYVLWTIFLNANAFSVMYFGRKVSAMIKESIAFHKGSKDKALLRQLRSTHYQASFHFFLFCLSSSDSTILKAAAKSLPSFLFSFFFFPPSHL